MTILPDTPPSLGDPAADAEVFLAALFPGDATGKLCTFIGGQPRWTGNRYQPGPGHQARPPVDYPANASAELNTLCQWSATRDVYLCSGLAYKSREDGSLKEIWALHVDWDGRPERQPECLEKLAAVGGFAIHSGTLGHLQCYVPLRQPITTSGRYADLCKAFQGYLPPGSDAAKHKWNDLLRLPGTLSHKSTVRPGDTGQPTPVTWALLPSGARRDADELAEVFGLILPAPGDPVHSDSRPAAPRCAANLAEPVPVDLDALPEPVTAALALATGDRSEDTARVVGACLDNGLTLAQTRSAVASRRDLAERLADRRDDDVLALWLKAIDARQGRLHEQHDAEAFLAQYLKSHQLNGSAVAPADVAHPVPDADPFEREVMRRLSAIRVQREAQRRLNDETAPPLALPPVRGLDAMLSEPDSAAAYLIEDVQPVDSRVMLSAQYKAGKTTLVGNLARSLVDGGKFLGRFAIHAPRQRVVLLDNELSENMLCAWLRDQGIVNTAAVADVIALRGKVTTFNLLDDKCLDMWAKRLRDTGCDYLVLDCLRPVLDALGLDENHDAGRFLVAYDALLDAAGVPNSVLVQHMGHANERARGDSRLQDWPDAIWRLVREDGEAGSARYFSAYGRDVDVRESALTFDPLTRRLAIGGGSRVDARTEAAMHAVIGVLAQDALDGREGLSFRNLQRAVTDNADHSRDAARDGIALAVGSGLVAVRPGPRNASLHSNVNPCAGCGKPMIASTGDWHMRCTPTGTGNPL